MAILKKSQLKEMSVDALRTKIPELQNEIQVEYMAKTTAGKPSNVGRMRTLRKTIARIKTLLSKKGAKEIEAPVVVSEHSNWPVKPRNAVARKPRAPKKVQTK